MKTHTIEISDKDTDSCLIMLIEDGRTEYYGLNCALYFENSNSVWGYEVLLKKCLDEIGSHKRYREYGVEYLEVTI